MNKLIDEWNDWLNNQINIEDKTIDAQGALLEDLSVEQQSFVLNFIDRWDESKEF
tara:strand:+ start:17866 stop:18030 length:165 start_codon:yes stop_codon:yes gene_type:complete